MASEDITFCMSDCKNMKCFRNKKHIIHHEFPHSFTFLEDTENCMNSRKGLNMSLNEKENVLKIINESVNKGSLSEKDGEKAKRIIKNASSLKYYTNYDSDKNEFILGICSCQTNGRIQMKLYDADKSLPDTVIDAFNNGKTDEEILEEIKKAYR